MADRDPRIIPSRSPDYDICRATGKRRYASVKKARVALRFIRQHSHDIAPCRIYRCPECGGLHHTKITSKEARALGLK